MFNPDFTDVPLVWEPTEATGRQTKKLRKIIENKYKVTFNDYSEFQSWSTEHLNEFWEEFWDFLGMISSKRFHKAIDLNVPMRESPKWYEGAMLNYAENLLRYRDDRIALIQEGEDSPTETYTYAQMYEQSKLYASAFRKFGLKKGDIVACYMSNRKEAVFAMHAATSIGAIWTGALPLLGSDAIVNRFKQVKPKVLLTVDRFVHDREEIDMLSKVKDAVQGLPSLEKVLIVASKADSYSKDINGIKNSCFLEEFLKLGFEKNGSVPEMQFEQVSFSHPVIISYTSGTTGLPKAILHGSGILMSICSCLGVTVDTDRDSVWLSVSPVGWASWSLYTTLQFLGETVVLYDGNPYYLTPTCIWDLVDKHQISNILFPASVVDELEKRKYVPTEKHDLTSLKYVMAGGSVVKRGSSDFMNKILPHALFTSAYGCTEVMGCCLVSETSMPLYKAEINAACVGTAVEIVDDAGEMDIKKFEETPPLWEPKEGYGTVMKKFKKRIAEKYNIQTENYWDLYDWFLDHIPELWAEIWDYSGLIYSKPYDKVVDLSIPLEKLPPWFEGAKLNLAENLLKYRDDRVAIITAGEEYSYTEELTFSELYNLVEIQAAAFRKFGLKKGDVVVCQMPNIDTAVFAMIAVTSIGAIWSGALPLLGAEAVLNRFKQVEPKIFLTIDQICHDGKIIEMLPKVKEIADGLPSLEKVVILPAKVESYSKDISGIRNSCFISDFLDLGRKEEDDGFFPELEFEQVSFDHPIFINYTSGTTGLPKPIVHGMGYLLAIFRDFSMHFDVHRDSVYFSMSPVGWATWNCFASLLFVGAAVVLYEGVPFFKSPTYFWDLLDKLKMTHVFIPTSIMDELQKRSYLPTKNHSLESLKVLMSGGSVVKSQLYDFVYTSIKKDVAFASVFGSTEFMGTSFVFDSTLPIYKGEIPARSLGVHVEVLDETGKPLEGEVGDLVVTKPMPNFPLCLWKDKDGALLREKYFSKFPGKFAIGDYGVINPITRGLTICCRSDETLKQRGCRFGSSEIYNVVELFPEIRDSLCVSQYNKTMDERAVLFLKIREGYSFSEKLVSRIREAITNELTTRHVPDVILEVKDIPYNANGKKMEIMVKKIINRAPYNAETIVNPESLKYFENTPELQGF